MAVTAETRNPGPVWKVDIRLALFFAYLAVSFAVYIFLVPPFQKADEPAHFHRAVSLTNLDLLCDQDEDGQYYWSMKRKYAELPDVLHYAEVTFDNAKFSTDWLKADFSDPRFDEPGRVYRFCSLPAPGYLPSALGILLGKPFENPLVSFYLGRIAGALFFLAALVLALRVCPERYRLLIYGYAALPLVLHQVSGITYDAAQLSLLPLIFAYLVRFVVQDGPIQPKQAIVFMALLWFVVNIRLGAYYPLLLLLFVIDRQKIEVSAQRYWLGTGAFFAFNAVTAMAYVLLYLPRAADSSPLDMGTIDATAQMSFVLDNPLRFLAASLRTLDVHGKALLNDMVVVLGWNVYYLNATVYYAVVFAAGAVCYHAAVRDVAVLSRGQLLTLLLALFLTAGALFLSLYLVWSPVGAGVVSGLQGRYFVGLLPFAIFAACQAAVALGRRRAVNLLLLVLALFLLFSVIRALELRYY